MSQIGPPAVIEIFRANAQRHGCSEERSLFTYWAGIGNLVLDPDIIRNSAIERLQVKLRH